MGEILAEQCRLGRVAHRFWCAVRREERATAGRMRFVDELLGHREIGDGNTSGVSTLPTEPAISMATPP